VSSFLSYGICSRSNTTIWTPTFRSSRCSCLRGFTIPPTVCVHNLFIRLRIWNKESITGLNTMKCDVSVTTVDCSATPYKPYHVLHNTARCVCDYCGLFSYSLQAIFHISATATSNISYLQTKKTEHKI
jgi:hypothetical protein